MTVVLLVMSACAFATAATLLVLRRGDAARVAELEAAVAGYEAERSERQELGLQGLVRKRVVAHEVEDGPSIRGFCVDVTPDAFVLERAEQLVSIDSTVPLAGRVWIPRTRLDFFQELGGGET